MNKEKYLFSELIFGLRSDYLENYKLFDELKKCMHVDGDNIEDISLYLETNSADNANAIKFYVNEKQSKQTKIFRYLEKKLFNLYHLGLPDYIVKKEGMITILE